MGWSTFWDLPAPFGKVLVTESAIRHIFYGHMTGEEPWDAVLTASLLNRLRGCWAGAAGERYPILEEVAALLEQAIRQGALRPLYLSYEQKDEARVLLYMTYIVITPDGFVAVIRAASGQSELKTAFFPDAVHSERPSRRWVGAVRSQVEQFARHWQVGGQEVLALPGPEEEVHSPDPPGFRTNIVFHDFKVWGFREVPFPDLESSLTVWGHPLPWPGKAEGSGPAAGPHKLKKPRRGGEKS